MTEGNGRNAMREGETIVRMLGEGGSITLSAVRGPEGWTGFTVVTDERTLFHLFGDDDGEGPEAYVHLIGPADTWEGALKLLDSYPWPMLHPRHVHPEFQKAVLAAVRERAADRAAGYADFVHDRLPDWELECSWSDGA